MEVGWVPVAQFGKLPFWYPSSPLEKQKLDTYPTSLVQHLATPSGHQGGEVCWMDNPLKKGVSNFSIFLGETQTVSSHMGFSPLLTELQPRLVYLTASPDFRPLQEFCFRAELFVLIPVKTRPESILARFTGYLSKTSSHRAYTTWPLSRCPTIFCLVFANDP
jgi:hypothetical protein